VPSSMSFQKEAKFMIMLSTMAASMAAAADFASWVDPCVDAATTATSSSQDTTLLRAVLQANVQQGKIGGVQSALFNYDAVRANPSQLRGYLRQLCKLNISALTPQESLAVHLNAYNALTIAAMVHFNPSQSIKQTHSLVPAGNIWKEKLGTIGGTKVSLDDIEHGTIRQGLSAKLGVQGRIHAGVVCASLSCPDLLPEPFVHRTVVTQLTAATRGWLGNPTKNPGPDGAGKLKVSKIFQWYARDFIAEAGSIHEYARLYGPSSWQVADNLKLEAIPYDWSLNAMNGSTFTSSAKAGASIGFLTLMIAAFTQAPAAQ